MAAKGRVRMQCIEPALSGRGFCAPVFHFGMIRRAADFRTPYHFRLGQNIRAAPGAERHRYPDSLSEFDASSLKFKGNS